MLAAMFEPPRPEEQVTTGLIALNSADAPPGFNGL